MEKFRLGTVPQGSNSNLNATSRLASDPPNLLIRADPGHVITLRTCTKACAICFTVGVFVGFTLKRRLRHWVTKILKRMKDD